MRIALSTDHTGYKSLQKLRELLMAAGHECIEFGPKKLDTADDYPDFIVPAARAVSSGNCDVGIIYGGSGQGEAMVANRVKGVRCAVFYGSAIAIGPVDVAGKEAQDNYEILRLTRRHNNANMLSLGARFLAWPDIEKAVNIWLSTSFLNEERHTRRIGKIEAL